MQFLTFITLATLVNAFKFLNGFHSCIRSTRSLLVDTNEPPTNRIAVIGAGAAGSSAAFWLSKAKERYGLDVEVDVFEKSGYIGGRSTVVYPHDDPSLEPMELGASIFVKANKNLWRATEEFGLRRENFEDADAQDDETGIWDGSEFVFRMGAGNSWIGSWWNSLKVILRYGYKAPSKTQAIVDDVVKRFLTLYTPSLGAGPWSNITELAEKFGWTEMVAQTGSEFLDLQGIDRRWTRELVEAATRVNYGQDIDKIHALEGLVSMAATGATSVEGGNYQIFENFIRRSNATIYLNTTVTSITRDNSTALWTVRTANASTVMEDTRHYRAVILAAPYHSTSISLSNTAANIPPQPYVHLHVTLLSTPTSSANSTYFNLPATSVVPRTILTTAEGVRKGGKEPEFNSMTFHGRIETKNGDERDVEEHLVKIFSKKAIDDKWLEDMFGQVTWVHRKEFDAYPVLPPTTTFPPIKLDQGFYYVNAFEPLISTMETETISARNVVSLLLAEYYNAAICKLSDPPTEANETFVYGWDC